jgi:adenosylcobinamide-GDP ribazoletransferase
VLAFQFLSVAPLAARRPASASDVGHSMAYFPLVGACIGLVLAGVDALLGMAFAEPVRVALVVAALLLLTRAIHLDGLMDSFDGLFGGWTPERRLAIMRDSRVGSFGVLAAAGDILVRFAALLVIPAPLRPVALVSALALARWSLVYATVAYPYARPSGMGAAYKAHVGRLEVALATLFAIVTVVAALGASSALSPAAVLVDCAKAIGMLALAWVVAGLFGRYVVARLPGQTGDTYGATNELVEVALLLAFGSPLLGLVG